MFASTPRVLGWLLLLGVPFTALLLGCPGPIEPLPAGIPARCTEGTVPTFTLEADVAEIGFAAGQGVTTHAEPLGVLTGVGGEDGIVARFLDADGVEVGETTRRARQLFEAHPSDRCQRLVRVVFPDGAPEGTFRFELEVFREEAEDVFFEVDAMCITEDRDDLSGC